MVKVSLRTWPARRKSPSFWVVTGAGVGMARPAPGTWGSAFGLLLGYIMQLGSLGVTGFLIAAVAITILSIFAINMIERETGIHDAPEIIIDEVAGQWLALIPALYFEPSLMLYLLAFLLFRLFDVVKPWPISWLDRHVSGGFGVMVDDLVAGIMSAISIWLLLTTGLLDGFI